MNKKEKLLSDLFDMWIHVGSARDNDEPVDCDEVQRVLREAKDFIEAVEEKK